MSTTSVPEAALLHGALQRLSGQSATCKLWSAILAAMVLLFAAGRVGGELLLCAGAPILFLALADAGYAFQTRRMAELGSSLDGNSPVSAADLFRLQATVGGFKALAGLLSFSVWPYYAGLAVVFAGLGLTVMAPPTKPAFPASASFLTQQGGPVVAQPSGFAPQPMRPPGSPFPAPAGARPSAAYPSSFPQSGSANRVQIPPQRSVSSFPSATTPTQPRPAVAPGVGSVPVAPQAPPSPPAAPIQGTPTQGK